MTYEIVFPDKALRQLKKLDKIVQGRIIAVLERIRIRPEVYVTKLGDFLLSSGTKKTTERTEDTENGYNSVISVSSVVDYPCLYHLSGGYIKHQ